MSKLPGYVSANLHLGDAHETVTNYAQWATPEDHQNALRDEEALKHTKLFANLAISLSTVICTKIWAHTMVN